MFRNNWNITITSLEINSTYIGILKGSNMYSALLSEMGNTQVFLMECLHYILTILMSSFQTFIALRCQNARSAYV